jgi:hypothetical protein
MGFLLDKLGLDAPTFGASALCVPDWEVLDLDMRASLTAESPTRQWS